jgi:hypothetical protein
MRTSYLNTMIVAFLLLYTNGIQAQTTLAKLNQVELMKQFVGSWKVQESKDTTFFWDAKPYGTGLDGNYKTVANGKTVTEGKFLQGYDKLTDKSIYVELSSGMDQDIDINATWFISKTKYKYIPFKDVSNYEKASYKIEGEFKSPDMFVETTIKNNKVTLIETYTRIK